MPKAVDPVPSCARKLADLRQACRLTQAALARQVGVSRQFFNQMEAGRVLPNVVIALRLASALNSTVEELFGTTAATAAEVVSVVPSEPGLTAGTRLRLGRIGRNWIAHPADTVGTFAAGFASADAVLVAPGRARLQVAPTVVATNLLIAGCDPALALLQPPRGPADDGRWHWIDGGSGRALDLLAAGQVHVAGIHYAGTEGSGNLQELRRRDPQAKWGLLCFTRWEQGWMLARDMTPKFSGIASLGTGKWRLANREASTAARRWLDRELAAAQIDPAGIPGYSTPLPSATDGAKAAAGGRADVALGPRALALAHGLTFVPVEAVDFDLVAPAVWWRSAAGRALKNRIAELAGTDVLGNLPGYVTTRAGKERLRKSTRRQTG
jgi:putative molybdopterin biosynthesis protein